MPAPALLFIVAAVAAKTVSVGWLASIATSPAAVGSRKRFLEHTQEALDNLERLEQIDPEKAKSLRRDIALLERRANEGWTDPEVFGTALSISSWKMGAHASGAVIGVGTLIKKSWNAAMSWMFEPQAPPPEDKRA